MADKTAKRQREGLANHYENHDNGLARSVKRPRTAGYHNVKPCHLYKLPRELRDMVYDYLWKATPLITHPTKYKSTSPYTHRKTAQ